ncbi:tetratricopeptide repeat protein [Desulfocicer vacuolatum]|nr:tetratricopeptide repeat protein [Desulfocicer vacuolatum]
MITGCASHSVEQTEIATSTKSLGEAYMAQGNYIAALKELLNAEKMMPHDPFLQYDLGLVYMAREKYNLAEIHLKKAIEMKKNYTAAMNSLGVVFMRQKKWDAAIAQFQKTSGNLLYATPHYPLSNMGWAYLGKNDYMRAETSFKKALRSKPDFINAIHGLATTYLTTGQSQNSRLLLEKAISKTPSATVLHADLAKTLEIRGQFTKAKASWQQVIQLAPDSNLADEARQRLK